MHERVSPEEYKAIREQDMKKAMELLYSEARE